MTSANARQVDGEHYKGTSMEHWDFVNQAGIGYLRGCASKYIYRWRSKSGPVDLQKAFHYIEKLIETLPSVNHHDFTNGQETASLVTAEFARINELPEYETDALMHLVTYDQVPLALEVVRKLLETAGTELLPQSNTSMRQELKRTKLTLALSTVALESQTEEHRTKMAELAAALVRAQAEIATLTTATGFTRK